MVVRCYATPAGLAALMLRAGDVPDPAALLDALSVTSARPATADEVSSATDQLAGQVGPVGLPADVALLSDSALGAGRSKVLYAPPVRPASHSASGPGTCWWPLVPGSPR